MVDFVDDGYISGNECPHNSDKDCHDGWQHQWVESGVEVVLLPVFWHKVLDGGIEACE